ncbi:MAG: hypothetical protein AVDCRST_MAG43-399 [uncultured Thermomicrobiales bacterium]|uniref:Uncharacterized protein n=1 Tax=uncultured Thermomicrobiales bacterium TaxID=1645740 RepID=A0A6J4U904_9BACT|nr:MAG: hypothetical protein AVDCRST_MAG43-399 [uncultured Thermomicrobiales bacterium]
MSIEHDYAVVQLWGAALCAACTGHIEHLSPESRADMFLVCHVRAPPSGLTGSHSLADLADEGETPDEFGV